MSANNSNDTESPIHRAGIFAKNGKKQPQHSQRHPQPGHSNNVVSLDSATHSSAPVEVPLLSLMEALKLHLDQTALKNSKRTRHALSENDILWQPNQNNKTNVSSLPGLFSPKSNAKSSAQPAVRNNHAEDNIVDIDSKTARTPKP